MEIKGIKFISCFFDGSGYAAAARKNVIALHKLGIPITLKVISFESARPDLGEEGRIISSLVDKKIEYNVVIMQTTPEFWADNKESGKLFCGLTIWETDRLHHSWPKLINDTADLCMVGCEWNIDVFKKSGVTVPLVSIPHVMDTSVFKKIRPYNVAGVNDDTYMFYFIGQWCYDDQTRVLTKDGFKYFKDLEYTDEIATLNKETEELEYHHPDKIVSFYRKDKMFSLKGHQFDICVTPDHKMVVKDNKSGNDSPWQLKPFNELIVDKRKSSGKIVSSKYRTKKNCVWKGKEEATFNIPKPEDYKYNNSKLPSIVGMDDFLTFMGWYLSEGSLEISKNYYRIAITQLKNKKNVEEIIQCITNMGFSPFLHNGKDILFNSRDLCLYLQQFGKHNEKFIPQFIKELDSRQIKLFLTSLFKGDGSLYENGDWIKYVTTSKKLAEDIQECLLKVGMSGAVSICDPKLKKPGKIEDRIIQGKKLQYVVSVNRHHNEPVMKHAKFKEIDYDGMIYCATVKNHTMLTERNGKIVFSGNTERKNVLSTIKTYWRTFRKGENVALVMKVYRSDYSDPEKEAIRTTIRRLKSVCPMEDCTHPPVYLVLDMLSEDEMLSLHARGDCYVSLDRGEGFGLSTATAGAAGNPIIATGFGGATEYLKPDNSYIVDFVEVACHGMPWSRWYSLEQYWAFPSEKHASQLMRHVYENQEEAKEKGKIIQAYIHDTLSWEVIGQKIIDALRSL